MSETLFGQGQNTKTKTKTKTGDSKNDRYLSVRLTGNREECTVRGVVLYRGPSQLDDGADIVVVATLRSTNVKVGDVPQIWILRADTPPNEAAKQDLDKVVCGDCALRGNGCYVVLFMGPLSVYKAWKRGIYPEVSVRQFAGLVRAPIVRVGAYGDPAAVPIHIWDKLRKHLNPAIKMVGYTHQWADMPILSSAQYARYFMASVESSHQRDLAKRLGYRTFRIRRPGAAVLEGEFQCPAVDDGSPIKMTCDRCGACDGSFRGTRKPDVTLEAHGSTMNRALQVVA